jgi:hypothetical protein
MFDVALPSSLTFGVWKRRGAVEEVGRRSPGFALLRFHDNRFMQAFNTIFAQLHISQEFEFKLSPLDSQN